MDFAHSRPLLCQELIGRKQELRELEALIDQAATAARFCLISGEAGLGKTRLCRAFVQMCRQQHATVLFGQASPYDQSLPFSLFLDLFRHAMVGFDTSPTPFQQVLQATFSFLSPFSSNLTPLLPINSLSVSDPAPAPTHLQSILFHQVLEGLQALSKHCQPPLVMVLEDLHSADKTSLDLLAFLAHRSGIHDPVRETALPLLIVGTYRSEALPDTPTLQHVVSHLTTQRQVDQLLLTPLNEKDHWQCVNHILKQLVPKEFARFLYTWDEGNPFFTEELLSAMHASGQLQSLPDGWLLPLENKLTLPGSLAGAILERFARLPLLDQEVLSYASVIGRAFDFPLLVALYKLDEQAVVQILHRAVTVQLISEVGQLTPLTSKESPQERYQFRHMLTREAIYERMLLSERRIRHRTVAETIEALASGRAPDASLPVLRREQATQLLVEHFHLAGLDERARPYALQEAQRAGQVGAFREECFYLDVAQASLPEESPERLQLLERLGLVSMGINDFTAALHWLSLARRGYQHTGQPSCVLRVLGLMLLPAWFLANHALPELLTEIEASIETAFAAPDQTLWDVNLLEASSMFTAYQVAKGSYQSIERLAERNQELFAFLTDPRKVAAIQVSNIARSASKVHQHNRLVEECIAEIRQTLHIAHQSSLPHVILFGYWTLTAILIFVGRLDEAKHVVEETIAYEHSSGVSRVSHLIGWVYFFSGEDWDQGIESMQDRIENLKRDNTLAPAAIESVELAHLLIARNELLKAQVYLSYTQPLLESMNENLYLLWMGWGFAKLYTAQEKYEQAQKWYERTLTYWGRTEDTLCILPILLDGITLFAQIGNLQQTKHWLTQLEEITIRIDHPVGKAALLEAQGIIAGRKKASMEAIDALRQAVDAWDSLKFRYRQALTSHQLAVMLLQQAGRKNVEHKARQQLREEADRSLQRAALIYEHLGITHQVAEVQRLRVSTQLDAQLKRRITLASKQREGLTSRELQILRLLATGKTNNEIASTLGITPGTVELHVTHILTKLRCENRTQAVLYGVSKGWIAP